MLSVNSLLKHSIIIFHAKLFFKKKVASIFKTYIFNKISISRRKLFSNLEIAC